MNIRLLTRAGKASLTLGIFSALFTLCMAGVYLLTQAPIAHSERLARMSLFHQIVADDLHDNDLLTDSIQLAPDALLGNHQPTTAQVARIKGQATAIIFEAIAHDGYSGDIKLLLAVKANGQLAGVRVIAHKETPGLGDYIEIAKGPWITLFDGLSLSQPSFAQWKIEKDGGQFDYRVGATITPRAVIGAVSKALQYVQLHHTTLFAPHKEHS